MHAIAILYLIVAFCGRDGSSGGGTGRGIPEAAFPAIPGLGWLFLHVALLGPLGRLLGHVLFKKTKMQIALRRMAGCFPLKKTSKKDLRRIDPKRSRWQKVGRCGAKWGRNPSPTSLSKPHSKLLNFSSHDTFAESGSDILGRILPCAGPQKPGHHSLTLAWV